MAHRLRRPPTEKPVRLETDFATDMPAHSADASMRDANMWDRCLDVSNGAEAARLGHRRPAARRREDVG